ncbi:hypothetical protein HK099_001947 [Clydaea vesicula]|uniref:Uncharacterized protein n=1 Tax=Clydaea vesicula TaxID=447962 RepID=A0AAD5XWY0_9FUNG|nr:hypothetical protein HK099_001947 [Clydaea vesicula]
MEEPKKLKFQLNENSHRVFVNLNNYQLNEQEYKTVRKMRDIVVRPAFFGFVVGAFAGFALAKKNFPHNRIPQIASAITFSFIGINLGGFYGLSAAKQKFEQLRGTELYGRIKKGLQEEELRRRGHKLPDFVSMDSKGAAENATIFPDDVKNDLLLKEDYKADTTLENVENGLIGNDKKRRYYNKYGDLVEED